ncbi:MAG: DUF58 domain-containing protein [Candidatus Methanosuratincola sp.]
MFLGLTFFVGFAALNTGNNLLYLTFGMMLSFIAASGVVSMLNLSRVEVKATLPRDVFAMTPAPFTFYLTNRKTFFSSYCLTLEVGGKRGYVPYLPSGKTSSVTLRLTFPTRGWHAMPEGKLYTEFPFGFFTKSVRLYTDDEKMLVYPKVSKIEINPQELTANNPEIAGVISGFGSEIRSLRDYVDGDNPKLIHWKVSAKAGRLILRELEEEYSRMVLLEFKPEGSDGRLEAYISLIASTFLALINGHYDVEFIAPDTTFPSHENRRSPRAVLSYLALFGG